jgi:hypothetical protein
VSDKLSSGEYERLVEKLVTELLPSKSWVSEDIKHDVNVSGRSTTNQIDVLWDLTDAAGQARRIVFEAKNYGRAVDQGRLHAFRSVVDDIQDARRPVTGVMVTKVGYQRGAKSVASTYGLIVLELRKPTDADRAGRVTKIRVTATMQQTVVDNLQVEAVEVYGEPVAGPMVLDRMELDFPSGRVPLEQVLTRGELGSLDVPLPPHPVRREFDPPVDLWIGGARAATVRTIKAEVGIHETPLTASGSVIRELRDIAWMIRNSLTGARTWIADDGHIWRTD